MRQQHQVLLLLLLLLMPVEVCQLPRAWSIRRRQGSTHLCSLACLPISIIAQWCSNREMRRRLQWGQKDS
jgi:hypothetical protein